MFANAGDHIVIHGRQVGSADRIGTIVDVRGKSGAPPYLVRWEHDGPLCLIYPGADAQVTHDAPSSAETERATNK